MREPYPGYYKEGRRYYLRVGVLMAVFFMLVVSFSCGAFAATLDPLIEHRYGGPPKRDAKGQIIRRADVLRAFQKIHPCPSTGLQSGACPRWKKDHVLSLACGGSDSVSNLQWLKTADWQAKSLYERKIYAATPPYPDTAACVNVIVP